jgi:hypothetical protein
VIDDAHGGGKLAVELLLTCLKNGDTCLKVELFLRLSSGTSDGLFKTRLGLHGLAIKTIFLML